METEHSSQDSVSILTEDYSNKEVSRGMKIINSNVITNQGRHWLTRAVDPFHDTQVKPCGYPDLDTSATVVQEVNLSMTISRPANVAATDLWDCHIFNMSDFASVQSGTLRNFSGCLYNPITSTVTVGANVYANADAGIVSFSGPVGAKFVPDTYNPSQEVVPAIQAVHPTRYVGARCRIVGGGFEVTNSTAEIYRQGIVTVYRQPQDQNVLWTAPSTGRSPLRKYTLPPSSVAQALVLPSSKQWAAAEGCYCVLTQISTENPLQAFDNLPRIYSDSAVLDDSTSSVGALVSQISSSCGVRYTLPFNTSGAYFTGLSPETTLQVNAKFLIEAVPDSRSLLVTMAQPSPMYDPEAIRLYSELCNTLPVGCPVGMNPDGEWFRSVLGTLGQLSTMAGGINPIFGVLGTGLNIASSVVPKIITAINASKEKKPTHKPEKPKMKGKSALSVKSSGTTSKTSVTKNKIKIRK